MEARRLLRALRDQSAFSVQVFSDAAPLVRDPTSVRFRSILKGEGGDPGMIRCAAVNMDLPLLASEWVAVEDANLCAALFTMTPFNPRVASELWSKSVPGAVDVLLGVFSAPVTPSTLANVDGDVFFGAFVSIEKNLGFESDFNTSTEASRDTYIGELCSDVVGITCPHPVGQARLTACKVDDTPDLNSVSAEGDPAR